MLAALALGGAVAVGQTDSGPGRTTSAGRVTPLLRLSESRARFSSGEPAHGFTPLISQPSPGYAEAVTPDIQALAQGLQNDPTRIFNFVHDHIQEQFYFGSKKGAELTLLERSGNDFDQCALLVSLLEAANFTNVGYSFGLLSIPYENPGTTNLNDVRHWLGLSLPNTNWTGVSSYFGSLLGNGGYGVFIDMGNTNNLAIQRVWVTLTIGSTNYYLDPAFKVTQPVAGINLPSAMGLNLSTLLSGAGGTDTGTSVSNLNEVNLRSALAGYAGNLMGYIQGNYSDATVAQIAGGRQIVPAGSTPLATSLMFTNITDSGLYPTQSWTSIPTNFMATFSVTFNGTNKTWFMPQLQGQRLALTFGATGTAQLWQNDTLLVQTNTSGSVQIPVTLNFSFPFGGWNTSLNAPISVNFPVSPISYQCTNANYALIYSFDASPQSLQQRQQQLDAYRQQGLADTSRQVVTETLNVMGMSWYLQTELVQQLLAWQAGLIPMNHYRFGRMGQESGHGYFVDVKAQLDATVPSTGAATADWQRNFQVFDVGSYFWSATEHAVIDQLQAAGLQAVSTVKILQLANATNIPIFLANSGNWSTIHLTNYASGVMTTLGNLIASNYTLLLPQSGAIMLGSGSTAWTGDGYVELLSTNLTRSMGTIIGNGYNGGYVDNSSFGVDSGAVSGNLGPGQPTTINAQSPTTPGSGSTSGDPVNMADGTFRVNHSDLVVGSPEPRGLAFSRSYSSSRRYYNTAGLANGWVHNYYINAAPVSAPLPGLGTTTPQQMVPMLVATCVALNLYNNTTPDPKNWLMTALIANWGLDQVISNAVTINLGQDSIQFVQQPGGAFTPPANGTMTLTQAGGQYALAMRHGNTFNFDTLNRLSTIVDPYGKTMSMTYTNTNYVWVVSDWKGRTLTFAYNTTVSPPQMTGVTDSSSRSVAFSYATNGYGQWDLVAATDPTTATARYNYDTNHQILIVSNELGQVVTTNLYDGFGRVAQQASQGNASQLWQFFWSGYANTAQDPAGGQTTYFYDDKVRQTGGREALGNVSQTFFDGQDHVVMTISPLNETNQFAYDANQNLLYATDPLGFSNTFVYDGNNNLVTNVDKLGNAGAFGYNAQFSLIGSTNGAGDWVTFTYNTDGTPAGRVDAGGTTSCTSYDTYGQLTGLSYPGSLGTESFVNSALGDVTSHTDAKSTVTTFQYDKLRRWTNMVVTGVLTNSVVYDAVGNVFATTNGLNRAATNSWSATRKLLTTTLPATSLGAPVFTRTYDNRDWLLTTANPLSQTNSYANDAAGRLASVIDPLLRPSVFGYDADGRQVIATNLTRMTQNTWSARGDLATNTDAAGLPITHGIDKAGNQITLTNRLGNRWQFQFDQANRLINTITPHGYSTVLAYNNRGLLAARTNALLEGTTYTYDALGRLSSRVDADTTTYGYDANSNPTSVTEGARSNVWTYDAHNRPSSATDSYGNLTQYVFDADGNLITLTYPGSRAVTYSYDSLDRLTNITDWAGRVTSFTYDQANKVTSATRPNGTCRTLQYDGGGQVTSIVEENKSGQPISWFKLNWNAGAQVSWEFGAPIAHSFTPPVRTMTFDNDNRIATFNTASLTYDPDGNLTSGPLTNSTLSTYGYDARDRLVSAGGITYTYDPSGTRTGVTNGGSGVEYVISPVGSQMLMRIKPGVTNYYVYGAGGLLYEVDETSSTTNTYTYHYDFRGSAVALTDQYGHVTDRMEYSTYGLLTYRAGTNDTPFLFNGRFGVQTDSNGLLYMRARYYNPYLCRFVNADPSGWAGGLNWYAFCNGDPVTLTDPFGLGTGEKGPFSWLPGPVGWAGDQINNFASGISGFGAGSIGAGLGFLGDSASSYGLTGLGGALSNAGQSLQSYGQASANSQNVLGNMGSYDPNSTLSQTATLATTIASFFINPEGAAAEGSALRWGPLNGGPLSDAVANTFRGGSYTESALSGETTLYRSYGGTAGEIGSYWTRTPPAGPLQATMDSALNPAWGNTAQNVSTIRVPTGTTIYEGFAAPQGGLLGGGSQVYIPKVNPNWLVHP